MEPTVINQHLKIFLQVFEEFERRFVLLLCSEERVHDRAYFMALWTGLQGQARGLARVLGQIDLSGFVAAHLPANEEAVELRLASMAGKVAGFVFTQLQSHEGIFDGKVDST
jgi:hypothetical protein